MIDPRSQLLRQFDDPTAEILEVSNILHPGRPHPDVTAPTTEGDHRHLGRLAVDRRYQRRGLGRDLLRDAVGCVLRAADIVGIRVILVHAISEEAKRSYLAQEFVAFPDEPMTLSLPLETARQALWEQDHRRPHAWAIRRRHHRDRGRRSTSFYTDIHAAPIIAP